MRYIKPVQFRYAPGSLVRPELEKMARVFLAQLQANLGSVKTGAMTRTGPDWTIRVAFVYGQPVVDISVVPPEEEEKPELKKQTVGIIARPRSFTNPHGWGPPFEVSGTPTTPPAGTVGANPPHDVAVYEFNGSARNIKKLVRGVDNYEYGNINIEQCLDGAYYLTSWWGYQSRDVHSSETFTPDLSATAGAAFNIRKGLAPLVSSKYGILNNTTYASAPIKFYVNGTAMTPAGPGSIVSFNGAFVIRKTDRTIWARWAVTVTHSSVYVDELWEQQIDLGTMTLVYATLNNVCTLSDTRINTVGSLFPKAFAPYAASSDGKKVVALSRQRVSIVTNTSKNVITEWTFNDDGVYLGITVPYESNVTSNTTTGGEVVDRFDVIPPPFTSPSGILYGPGGRDPTGLWLVYTDRRRTPTTTESTTVTYIGAAYDATDTIVPLISTAEGYTKGYYDFWSGWSVYYSPYAPPEYPDGMLSNVGDGAHSYENVDTDNGGTFRILVDNSEVANAGTRTYSREYGTRSETDPPTTTFDGGTTESYIHALYADLQHRDCVIFREDFGTYSGSTPPPTYTMEIGGNILLSLTSTTSQTNVRPVISAFRDKQTGLILVSAFIAITDISGGSAPDYILVCEKGNFFAAPAFITKVNTQDDDSFLFPIGPYRAEWVI